MSGDHNMYQKTKSYLDDFECPRCGHCCQALETEREWIGLTDEEIQDLSYLSQKIDASNSEWFDRWGFSRAIEAKLREKNHG